MTELQTGDRVAIASRPYLGEQRIRGGDVFSVEGDRVLAEVRAPGVPDWPCTIEVADERDGCLMRGDRGDEVTELQADLYALGFTIETTGHFDEQTRTAVRGLHQALGLPQTGVVTLRIRERIRELVRCNRAEH